MSKIVNTFLLLIFMVLVGLYAYKVLVTPSTFKAEVGNEATKNQQIPENGLNRQEIENIIKEYIANNPEEIIQSLEGLQQKKTLESAKKAEDYLKDNQSPIENLGNPPVIGNKNGDIIIVMFYDYGCGFCRKAHEYIRELLRIDQGVKVILRPIPILGDVSLYSSKVALALNKISPEKFSIIHDGIMSMKTVNNESIKALITQSNIDYTIVENEINSYSIRELVNKNYELAQSIGMKGAPSYVINGKFIAGLLDVERLKTIIGELRKSGNQP